MLATLALGDLGHLHSEQMIGAQECPQNLTNKAYIHPTLLIYHDVTMLRSSILPDNGLVLQLAGYWSTWPKY